MPKPSIDLATAVHGAARGTERDHEDVGSGAEKRAGILVRVERSMRRQLRRIAVDEDRTLQDVCIEAFKRLIEERGRR